MLGQWSGIQTLKHQSMAFGLQAMQIVLVSWVTVLFFQTIEFALAVTNFSCLQKYFIDALRVGNFLDMIIIVKNPRYSYLL